VDTCLVASRSLLDVPTNSEAAAPTPSRRLKATAWGFIIGSTLFALGVPLSLVPGLSPSIAGWTFFAGSVFFTTAALLQFLSSREALGPLEASSPRGWLTRVSRPRTTDWTSSAIQFVGTLAFNLSTFRAAVDAAGETGPYSLIWRPDVVGSILFLVSSWMAFSPEVRWRRHPHARDRSWTIGALNFIGSVFFGLSAIGAYLIPADNTLLNAQWSNGGTLLGALCFLAGAILLVPRRSPSPA
jgi:hypothetical protein